MANKLRFKLPEDKTLRNPAVNAVLNAPTGYVATVQPDTRTPAQNSQQWPILTAFSKQVKWPVNGEMVYMTPDDWKDLLTAAYKRESVRVAMAFDGMGMVMLGQRTSKYDEKTWPDWMAFLNYAAAEKGVKIPVSKRQLKEMGLSDD